MDAGIIIIAYILAYYVRLESRIFPVDPLAGRLSWQIYMTPLIFIVPGYLILYAVFHLYTPKRVQGRRLEFSNIIKANSVGFLVFIMILYMIEIIDFSRQMIMIFYVFNILLETLGRNAIRYILHSMRERGFNLKHILLVGYSRAAEAYIDRINSNPQWGYIVRGILDDKVPAGTVYKGVKVIGRIDNLMIILPENRLDEIAITLSLTEYARLEEIVNMCEKSGVHTKFIPDYNHMIPTKPYTEDLLDRKSVV